MIRFFIKILLIGILLFSLTAEKVMSQNKDLITSIGSTKELFSGISERDVRAIIEIYTKIIYDFSPLVKEANTYLFDDMNTAINAVNNSKIDLLFLTSRQYIENKKLLNVTPYYISLINNKDFIDLYLLGDEKLKIKSFNELKGSTITLQSGRYKSLCELWLDVLCLENGINSKEEFFKEILYQENPSKSILNVVFHKSDLCITTDNAYKTIVEMNPQVSATTLILEKRKNLVNDIYCIRNGVSQESISKMTQFALSLSKEPKAKQVNKIFKIDGAVLINENHLKEIEKLVNEYKYLKSKKSKS